VLVAGLLVLAVTTAGWATNWLAAAYVFLGAFTYGVVYTLWLKRRTWINIVIGGLAGSFAVLAGAAAIDPMPGPAAWTFAVVLFLWTPPHFWSLSMYYRQDYADAGVPMLPVVFGDRIAARAILGHTIPLALLSLLPLAWGAGAIMPAAQYRRCILSIAACCLRANRRGTALLSLRAAVEPAARGAIVDGALAGHLGMSHARRGGRTWRRTLRSRSRRSASSCASGPDERARCGQPVRDPPAARRLGSPTARPFSSRSARQPIVLFQCTDC
jgi:hypothetical protein